VKNLYAALFVMVMLSALAVLRAQTEDWLWAQKAGGTSDDYGRAIAIDSDGNSYVTGYFSGTATFGNILLTSYGGVDIYIAKLDTNGDYLWAKNAGGDADDYGYGISTDSSGSCYITGYFYSSPATFGTISILNNAPNEMWQDIFISKLDTNGNFLWAKKAGGTSNDQGYAIATDSYGNCYVTGWFRSNATFGTTTISSNSNADVFITKLNTNGNFLWAMDAGGTGSAYVEGYAIATDSNGNCYVTGYFGSTEATFGTTTLTTSGGYDIFIAKLSTNGSWLWAKSAGGSNNDYGYSIDTDSSGNCYVTGWFISTATWGSISLISSGSYDIFITKLDTSGNYIWAKKAGGTSSDTGYGINTDSNGNCYITGYFSVTAIFGTISLISSGSADTFVSKLDSSGNYLWASQAGGTGSDYGRAIATDIIGNSYVTGDFVNSAVYGPSSLTSYGNRDMYVANFGVPTYTVLSPNGGETWQTNTSRTVYWNVVYMSTQVNVLLSIDNGANWILLNSTPVMASLGHYSFNVPSISSSQCLIKVISTNNSAWFDISDAPFTISSSPLSSIDLTAPTNAKLQTGKNYSINWTAAEVSTVNLDYTLDAGVSWNSIVSSIPANLGTYIWTVPETPSAVCYLRISDAGNPDVYDWNDLPFTISSLQLINPNGGNLYQTGSHRSISWTSAQVGSVMLEYSPDSGTSWTQIIASTTAAYGSYSWTVPVVASNQYLIRISDVVDSAINDNSDIVFTVAALAVTYPNDIGIKLQVGRQYNLTWNQIYLPGTVKLEYTVGSAYIPITTGVDAFLGSYLWTVPDTPSTSCKIRVTSEMDALVLDTSNNNFAISKLDLITPNGGDTWGTGIPHVISWYSINVINVNLEYSIDNGNGWSLIASSVVAANGSYNWVVPAVNSSECRLRITDADSATINDTSDLSFTIFSPYITVIAPNGNETISVNSVCSIFWEVSADINFILIDYSINSGSNWVPIQSEAYPATVGRYDWLVPNNPSVNCLVKVRSFVNSEIYDVSDVIFEITSLVSPPTVNFIADITEGLEPLNVIFTDASIAGSGSITDWLWDFGDGNTSILQNPQHIYQNDGLYNVSLTVTNSYDSTRVMVREDYINVLPRFPVLGDYVVSLNLGEAYLGYYSEPHDLWLKNTGTADLTINSLSFYQTSSPFSVPAFFAPIQIAEGDSVAIQVVFTPQVAGVITDSLYINNNSENMPVAVIGLRGTGVYVPPKPPENVNIAMNGYNAMITWDAVTQTIFDTPITPDYYLVFYNGSSDPETGLYYYHGSSNALTYTHYLVGLHAQHMFYRVVAYKYYRDDLSPAELDSYLKSTITPGMTEADVRAILDEIN